MPRTVVFQLPRSYRFAVLALMQLALAALLLLQALHLNTLTLSIGQSPVPAVDTMKQATRQHAATEAQSPLVMPSSLDAAALAARLPRRPPMRAPARRTIFETVERRWKEYRLLGTQRFA